MPAKLVPAGIKPGAGIQDFKYLNENKKWIPAFAGMTSTLP